MSSDPARRAPVAGQPRASEALMYGRLPFYASMFAAAGYPPDADGTLPEALLDELVVAGTTPRVAARLVEIQAQGLDELLVMLVPVADADAEERAPLRALSGGV